MSEWKYPGDEVVRLAFTANVLEVIKEKNLTPEEVEKRIAAAHQTIDHRLHERAFGRAVKKLREERNLSRKALAVSAKIPVRLVMRVERGRGGDISVPEVCRIACALKLLPHELMEHYQNAVKEADTSEAWW
jgi:predicted transcriptional regulator